MEERGVRYSADIASWCVFVWKAVELDIQKIEASQARRHVQLLTAFLPETFVRRGGESFNLHRRSIALRGGCFRQNLFVYFFVCLSTR